MSRIGKRPIPVPNGVEVKLDGGHISVKGPKGTLSLNYRPEIGLKHENEQITCEPVRASRKAASFHGLTRTLINNMVVGVSTGFSRSLTLIGVGYRAAAKGKAVTLTLGYSHPVEFEPPEGIELKVENPTTVIVSGADKELVGRTAAKIRSFRPPEPYHGKGVRYSDERIITKVGKASGKK